MRCMMLPVRTWVLHFQTHVGKSELEVSSFVDFWFGLEATVTPHPILRNKLTIQSTAFSMEGKEAGLAFA